MTEEEKNKQYAVVRKGVCIWCGKSITFRVTRETPYTFYRWCPECQKKRAEQKEIGRRNEEYKITHKWSRKEGCIADNTKKARELGMSYGKYMALKNAGAIKD